MLWCIGLLFSRTQVTVVSDQFLALLDAAVCRSLHLSASFLYNRYICTDRAPKREISHSISFSAGTRHIWTHSRDSCHILPVSLGPARNILHFLEMYIVDARYAAIAGAPIAADTLLRNMLYTTTLCGHDSCRSDHKPSMMEECILYNCNLVDT